MSNWDGKLPSHCGFCHNSIRVEFRILADHKNNGSEPICIDCAKLRDQVRQSISNQKETV